MKIGSKQLESVIWQCFEWRNFNVTIFRHEMTCTDYFVHTFAYHSLEQFSCPVLAICPKNAVQALFPFAVEPCWIFTQCFLTKSILWVVGWVGYVLLTRIILGAARGRNRCWDHCQDICRVPKPSWSKGKKILSTGYNYYVDGVKVHVGAKRYRFSRRKGILCI